MDLATYLLDHQDSFNAVAQSLYQRLTATGATINFEVKDQETWGMQEGLNKTYTIIDPGKGANPPAMIHELLHVDLAQHGFKNDVTVQKHFESKKSFFGTPYGGSLTGELKNKIAHVRMIRKFKSLGNDPETFLQDTANTYFENGIKKDLDCMLKLKDAGISITGSTILKFICYTVSARLFGEYTDTKVSDEIFQMLKDIDPVLFQKVEKLYDDWMLSDGYDNFPFYERAQELLDEYKVPPNYQPVRNDLEDALCNESMDIFEGLSKRPNRNGSDE